MSETTERRLDPELVCTRVMARLIEDIGCVVIAPDSPAWSDLGERGEKRAGELRIYRGRGRVQKIVSSCLNVPALGLDSHSLVLLTQPESAVPHLLLDTVQLGQRVTVHVDLLPKRDLAVHPDYLERCYAPLSNTHRDIAAEPRFQALPMPLSQRALLSPWGAYFAVEVGDLGSAEPAIDRYLEHWVSLLKSNEPDLNSAPELATRDLVHRRILFRRAVDPTWGRLDGVIGTASVDQILAALTG